ncbi:hypothetical protein ACFL27_21945, partial [candidate division CSSED10-310 bacterium]
LYKELLANYDHDGSQRMIAVVGFHEERSNRRLNLSDTIERLLSNVVAAESGDYFRLVERQKRSIFH